MCFIIRYKIKIHLPKLKFNYNGGFNIYCSNCELEYPGEPSFCTKCGTELENPSIFCSECGSELNNPSIICPKCANENSSESVFCSKCSDKLLIAIKMSENLTDDLCPVCSSPKIVAKVIKGVSGEPDKNVQYCENCDNQFSCG